MELTPEQVDILKASETEQHLICQASAGCGKSTTIFELIKHNRVPTLILSFNKAIAEENKAKAKKMEIDDVCTISTFHSFGISLFPNKISVNTAKIYFTCKEYLSNYNIIGSTTHFFENLRSRGFVALNFNSFKEGVLDTKWHTSKKPKIPKGTTIEILYDIYNALNNNTKQIDFSDMCLLPLVHGYIDKELPYERLYVDEIQDLNTGQVLFIQRILQNNPKIKIICFGDKKQQIYGFRGALTAFDDITEILGHPKMMPLNTTFRCASEIVKFVNNKCAESEMITNKEGGDLKRFFLADYKDLLPFGLNLWGHTNVDMIISSRNSTLISLWITLSQYDMPAYFKGGALATTLLSIVKSIPTNNWYKFIDELHKLSGDDDPEVPFGSDYAESILELIQRFRLRQKFEVIEKLELMKKQKPKGISLETIWGAKGREADHVLFIWEFWTSKQREEQKYVALTRAKNKLTVIIP